MEAETQQIENKVVEKTSTFKKVLVNIIILLLLFCFGVGYYAKFIGTSGILVKEYRVENEKIPVNFSGIKIIHFSDLLYKSTVEEDDLIKIIKKMNVLKPDIVIFTGGLISENIKLKEQDINSLKNQLSKIDASIGKYYIKGNEDFNEYYEEIMNESDFIFLNNSYELIYNNGLTPIFIGGLPSNQKEDVKIEEMYKYYENLTISENTAHYKIVLIHEGDIATKLMSADIETDLILGGNSLNGSVIIPYFGPLMLPEGSKKYYEPYYKEGNTDIYISSGIGTYEFGYRIQNKPSFNFYRLKSI